MYTELKYIRNALLRIIVLFFVLVFVFLTVTIPPMHSTVAEWGVESVRTELIPPTATLAVMSPLDPFFALASLAAALATLLTIPFFMWELWRFAAPALTLPERSVLAAGLFGAFILAFLGSIFAYFVLIPLIFSELYAFLPQGVVPLFNLRIVLAQVTALTLGTALMFLLPLLMILLTWARLVPVYIWSRYMRHAVLLVLVASAIITPDGSGVGMMLLAIPVCALYGLGYLGARLTARTKN